VGEELQRVLQLGMQAKRGRFSRSASLGQSNLEVAARGGIVGPDVQGFAIVADRLVKLSPPFE
jgi:hypothetical protein